MSYYILLALMIMLSVIGFIMFEKHLRLISRLVSITSEHSRIIAELEVLRNNIDRLKD